MDIIKKTKWKQMTSTGQLRGRKRGTKGIQVNFYLPIFRTLIKWVTHFLFARLSQRGDEIRYYEMICLVLAGPCGNKKSNQVVCQFTFAVKDNESNFLIKQTFYQLVMNDIRPYFPILQRYQYELNTLFFSSYSRLCCRFLYQIASFSSRSL